MNLPKIITEEFFNLLLENKIEFIENTYFKKLTKQLMWRWSNSQLSNDEIKKIKLDTQNLSDDNQNNFAIFSIAAENLLVMFFENDPTEQKKYSQWMIKKFLQNEYRIEDITAVGDRIKQFDRLKTIQNIQNIDIGQLSLSDLRSLTKEKQEILHPCMRNLSENPFIISGEAKVLYMSRELIIISPLSKEAAKNFGCHTEWCTAAKEDNRFNQYPGLYDIFDCKNNIDYQLYFDDDLKKNQFKNHKDEDIDINELLEEWPVIFEVLDSLKQPPENWSNFKFFSLQMNVPIYNFIEQHKRFDINDIQLINIFEIYCAKLSSHFDWRGLDNYQTLKPLIEYILKEDGEELLKINLSTSMFDNMNLFNKEDLEQFNKEFLYNLLEDIHNENNVFSNDSFNDFYKEYIKKTSKNTRQALYFEPLTFFKRIKGGLYILRESEISREQIVELFDFWEANKENYLLKEILVILLSKDRLNLGSSLENERVNNFTDLVIKHFVVNFAKTKTNFLSPLIDLINIVEPKNIKMKILRSLKILSDEEMLILLKFLYSKLHGEFFPSWTPEESKMALEYLQIIFKEGTLSGDFIRQNIEG